MELTKGLPLIQLVRDFYMNTEIDDEIESITHKSRFTLFHYAIMGLMYGIVLMKATAT